MRSSAAPVSETSLLKRQNLSVPLPSRRGPKGDVFCSRLPAVHPGSPPLRSRPPSESASLHCIGSFSHRRWFPALSLELCAEIEIRNLRINRSMLDRCILFSFGFGYYAQNSSCIFGKKARYNVLDKTEHSPCTIIIECAFPHRSPPRCVSGLRRMS